MPCALEESPTLGLTPPDQQTKFSGRTPAGEVPRVMVREALPLTILPEAARPPFNPISFSALRFHVLPSDLPVLLLLCDPKAPVITLHTYPCIPGLVLRLSQWLTCSSHTPFTWPHSALALDTELHPGRAP